MIIKGNTMNYAEFKSQLQTMPLLVSQDLLSMAKDKQVLRNQLNRWHKKGLIIKLKRGVYQLNETDRKVNPSLAFIANQLYGPSYVSLEYALQVYDLIPEAVWTVTSVTTKKTMKIKNKRGSFNYRHVKPQAFRGFKSVKDSAGLTYFIAEPAKAVIDFLYLRLDEISDSDKEVFEESFRFQNLESVKAARLRKLATLFDNKKLMRVVKNFCTFLKKG